MTAVRIPITCPACNAQLILNNGALPKFKCNKCGTVSTKPPPPPPPAARSFTGRVVAGIATFTFLLGGMGGCMVGCSYGHFSATNDSPSSTSPTTAAKNYGDIPRISPVPITPSDDEKDSLFASMIQSIPIAESDGKMLAAAACLAFKQNPGTTTANAVRQLASKQAWTVAQATKFLTATTTAYCPEYRNGS